MKKYKLGIAALIVILIYALVGLYAPLLASSKPLVVRYEGRWFFPLFRYLLFRGFYTKPIDLFFNALMISLPVMLLGLWRRPFVWLGVALQIGLFSWALLPGRDPAFSPGHRAHESWRAELRTLSPYARLHLVLRHEQALAQHQRLLRYSDHPDSLWRIERDNEARLDSPYLRERRAWLERQHTSWQIMPLLRPFHWQEDAGGSGRLNRKLPWWEMTRINRKDLVAGLIFGVRVSLVVGASAVALSLLIGMPLGALAGYYGGRLDLLLSRFVEIWESMPTFFMLLTVVAILQTKSIFLIVLVLGAFGWTGFCRYMRAEVLKQRNLAYVEASHSLGFRDRTILFAHILPNAIPPLLTLLPFSMMAAITSEAGLSFLGLGEEGSTSWGVLMDEGRSAFPAESLLLWPPAIALTILLIAIALVGDAFRDALDPKLA